MSSYEDCVDMYIKKNIDSNRSEKEDLLEDSPIKAALNGLLMLSKKSLNSTPLSRSSSTDQFDSNFSIITPTNFITPCHSPIPGLISQHIKKHIKIKNNNLNKINHKQLGKKRIHRVVLTGGPCAGKTTSINRIKTFFENIGWKVLKNSKFKS